MHPKSSHSNYAVKNALIAELFFISAASSDAERIAMKPLPPRNQTPLGEILFRSVPVLKSIRTWQIKADRLVLIRSWENPALKHPLSSPQATAANGAKQPDPEKTEAKKKARRVVKTEALTDSRSPAGARSMPSANWELMTVKQAVQRFPIFSEGALRYLIFHAHTNGFDSVIRRVPGQRRVLLDDAALIEWMQPGRTAGSRTK